MGNTSILFGKMSTIYEKESLFFFTYLLYKLSIEFTWTVGCYLLIELTLGTLSLSHTLSASSRSRISQANMVGFWRL